MKCIVGSASQAKHGWEWAGEGGTFWSTTSFSLGEQRVTIFTTSPTDIEEGDVVAVSGTVRDDVLKGLAHRNLTKGTQNLDGLAPSLVIGVFFLCVTFAALGSSSLVALFAAAVAAYFFSHAYRVAAAIHALKNAA